MAEMIKAEMVKFKECLDGEMTVNNYGFLLDDGKILCGCCGYILKSEPEKGHTIEVLERLPWIDITEAISGD